MSERPPVSLVGAGPGDPGLITVAAVERLRQADVIVYDRLVAPKLLEHARPDAELIYVGKIPGAQKGGHPSHDQGAINRVLVEKGLEGKRVVRLKGGDPFVFGRGGEEAEALREAGIPFEIIPGVTSAVAVPAYAGIPVTHRGVATSFAVITGHEDAEKEESTLRWDRLAAGADTLVFLMGTKALPDIVQKLLAHGRSPETPAAVIQWGTTDQQRAVTGTLADIVQRIEDAGLTPPAVTVVGDVVRLRETLSWFEETAAGQKGDRPLAGRTVLITRTRKQASSLARLLAAEGAVPIELPAIEIQPAFDDEEVARAVDDLADGAYAWAGFTSANAAEMFFELLARRGLDARAFSGARVFAIGPATAGALRSRGIVADVVPQEYVAEAVVGAMRSHVRRGDRVLLPRAESAREELVSGLEGLGARVDEVTIYRAAVPQDSPSEALEQLRSGHIDIVTFTSSSTVRNLASMLGGGFAGILAGTAGQKRPLVACIGPVTAKTAEELGLRVDVVASEYTVEGLVRAVVEHVEHDA